MLSDLLPTDAAPDLAAPVNVLDAGEVKALVTDAA
jgi:hypothetical protein